MMANPNHDIMLRPAEALEYEMAVTFGGTLIMMVLQVFTGPILTWILWALSTAVVTLSYVDHVCIGWKVVPNTQFRRVVWNIALCCSSALGLYGSCFFLMPEVDLHNLQSVLRAVQTTIRVYNYWGPLIYFGLYVLFYLSAFSFFRALINSVLFIWALVQTLGWDEPAPANAQPPPTPSSAPILLMQTPAPSVDHPHVE